MKLNGLFDCSLTCPSLLQVRFPKEQVEIFYSRDQNDCNLYATHIPESIFLRLYSTYLSTSSSAIGYNYIFMIFIIVVPVSCTYYCALAIKTYLLYFLSPHNVKTIRTINVISHRNLVGINYVIISPTEALRHMFIRNTTHTSSLNRK